MARPSRRRSPAISFPRPDAGVKTGDGHGTPANDPATHGRPRAGSGPFGEARAPWCYPGERHRLRSRPYGELDEFGASSKGLDPDHGRCRRRGRGAPTTARWNSPGPFKGYGQILIIQHGDGYHSLAWPGPRPDRWGGRLIGSWRASPVGANGFPASRKPRLYLELRHKRPADKPVAVVGDFATKKVSG